MLAPLASAPCHRKSAGRVSHRIGCASDLLADARRGYRWAPIYILVPPASSPHGRSAPRWARRPPPYAETPLHSRWPAQHLRSQQPQACRFPRDPAVLPPSQPPQAEIIPFRQIGPRAATAHSLPSLRRKARTRRRSEGSCPAFVPHPGPDRTPSRRLTTREPPTAGRARGLSCLSWLPARRAREDDPSRVGTGLRAARPVRSGVRVYEGLINLEFSAGCLLLSHAALVSPALKKCERA